MPVLALVYALLLSVILNGLFLLHLVWPRRRRSVAVQCNEPLVVVVVPPDDTALTLAASAPT